VALSLGPGAWGEPSTAADRPAIEQFLEIRGQYGAAIAPDGSAVACLDRATGVAEAWIVPVTGGWPEQLTFFGERVQTISWSPYRREHLVVERDLMGTERTQLFLLDPSGGAPVRLTRDDDAVHGFGSFSPDGRTIAFRSNRRNPAYFDIHLRDLVTGESRPLLEQNGTNSAGRFSPDGGKLIVTRTYGPDHNQLFVVDVATGEASALTAESPPARHAAAHWSADGKSIFLLTDRGRDVMTLARLDVAARELRFVRQDRMDAEDLLVSPNGRHLALVLNVDGLSELVLLDLLAGEVPELEPAPPLPVGVILGLDWTRDGERLAVTLSSSRSPGTVYVWDRVRRELTQITRPSLGGVRPELFADPTVIRHPSFDGRTISGIFYRPALAPGSPPPPCLVIAHGGPTGQSRPGFSLLAQLFVTRGCAVFMPNVRGSSGFGREFRRLDDRERREDAVADLERGVMWLADRGEIDSTRVAVYGSSYGGYMVLAALTLYPERFAAGVDQVGIANFVSFLEQTAPYRRANREVEYGSLEADRALLERLSPIHRVDRIRAPLLVLHGANDPRVPVAEAEQIVTALEARGHPVEFLRLDDEGHGVAQQENRRVVYGTVARFLAAHLGLPAEPPLPAPAAARPGGGGE
jgi:dipeptidyl aminopeptidase/acylaminoacyl peptidase